MLPSDTDGLMWINRIFWTVMFVVWILLSVWVISFHYRHIPPTVTPSPIESRNGPDTEKAELALYPYRGGESGRYIQTIQ